MELIQMVIEKDGPEWALIFLLLLRDHLREKDARAARERDVEVKAAMAKAIRALHATIGNLRGTVRSLHDKITQAEGQARG